LDTWFGRTIIRSCHEMYYEMAQRILDEESTEQDLKVLPDINQLRSEIRILTDLAANIQRKRIERGAVELESTEIRFNFEKYVFCVLCLFILLFMFVLLFNKTKIVRKMSNQKRKKI